MRNVKFKIQNLIFRYNLQLEEHWWMMYRGARMQYDPLTSSQYLNPEATLLKKVMTWRLIAIFFGTVAFFIILSGYLFNFVL